MRVVVLREKRLKVAAVADAEAVPARDFLLDAPAELKGSARGMWALFDRYAEGGRQKLTAELFHEADRGEQIWEFVKGRLRLYCFIDDGAVVILTHGTLKKSQKVARQDVARAVSLRAAYLDARRRGSLQWERLDHE